MSQTYDHAEDVLRECVDKPDAVLVVLTDVTGGTLRARGAMMAVTSSQSIGYISNGCVDADVVARARAGQSGTFIYGEGSLYRDIVLPCGGRLEITIIQNPDQQAIRSALVKMDCRQSAQLRLGGFSVSLLPRIKIRIAGRGAACVALAELAKLSGFDVSVQSPDADIWPDTQHLRDPANPPSVKDDPRTAVVCLFHDHDWEAALLKQALSGAAFYVGAMGSERTHELRIQNLVRMGVAQPCIARINAPIGLVASQRDARLLALSVLAEIIQFAQKADLL
ncbi:MAG: XdhC family protein [Litorimonas sp.]